MGWILPADSENIGERATFLATMTPSEGFLWRCAAAFHQTEGLPIPADLDWERLLSTTRLNRAQSLVYHTWRKSPEMQRSMPDTFERELLADRQNLEVQANKLERALIEYLKPADAMGIQSAVLKGLWLSHTIYEDGAMRPGGDIDLLVRRDEVGRCLDLLDQLGYGRFWPNLLDDTYYDRHHLHQQRCSQDLKIWFEIHWALDHPYTLLTVDYQGIMDRASPGELLGAPVWELTTVDQILTLALHLVKHAVYLPHALERDDLAQLILADGMLMYYLDVAEVIRQHLQDIDWDLLTKQSLRWGAGPLMRSVLYVCQHLLESPVPTEVLTRLPRAKAGRMVRSIHDNMAEYELARYRGAKASRMWDFLTITNGAFVLRPIRALDSLAYLFPPSDFLQRRYGGRSSWIRIKHFSWATAKFFRLGLDTGYYTWERYRRLKALHQSASLFNRLEPE